MECYELGKERKNDGRRSDCMIKVIFRKDKENNEVIAFLPQVEARRGNIVGYAHVGQHFEADYLYYLDNTKAASEEEYTDLLRELQSIYDNELVVRKRIFHNDLTKSWTRS